MHGHGHGHGHGMHGMHGSPFGAQMGGMDPAMMQMLFSMMGGQGQSFSSASGGGARRRGNMGGMPPFF